MLLLAGCKKDTRRDVLTDLRPKLSQLRSDLVALAPSLPDVGTVQAARVPEGVLDIDDDDPAQDNTIIIGLDALRAPNDMRKDDPLEAGFAYRHRYLGCLRDSVDGSESGSQPADEGYRALCDRAASARYALIYRVAKSVPARFEKPAGGEFTYEPGSLAVEWFVVDLGPPEARAAKVVGELVTSAKTPESMTISVDVGTAPGMVDARKQAAAALSDAIRGELVKALQGKAHHVDLDPAG
ncbi:MAG: hypothetical protein U1F43_14405 [Myxococcota bacterium]